MAVVVAASMVVVVSVVEVSMAAASVVAVSTVALWLPDTLEAESAAAAVELASAERTSQVVFRTLLAQGRASLQLVIHHPGSLSMMDGLLDPFLPTSRAIMPRWLQQRVHRKHFHNAE